MTSDKNTTIEKIKEHLWKHEFEEVFDLFRDLDLGNLTGYYYDLQLEIVDNPKGFSRTDLRFKISTLVRLYELQNGLSVSVQKTSKLPQEEKISIIEALVSNLDEAIKSINGNKKLDSDRNILMVIGEYNDLKREYIRGTIDKEYHQNKINSIRGNLLLLISSLRTS